ncbi:hypothetical protein ACTNC1_05210 [Atopobiaceae bacterium HCP3S3_A4]
MRLTYLIDAVPKMTIWQDRILRGCCDAYIYNDERCRGFAFRFPKPKIMDSWLNFRKVRDNIDCGFATGRTEELGEFEIIVFLGGSSSTKNGGPSTYAVLIEIGGEIDGSKIGILDEGIADEVNDRHRNWMFFCYDKAQECSDAIVNGTASIDDVLFIDTSII